ncbi:MAG: YheC/YheD family protein, partial [Firmicutes bacterium]|nr:YheC/YheD family protein [Bacillota bacterium]
VASAIVRWAEAGSVATNTSRGAVAVPLDQFLWKHGGQVPGAPDLAERVEELTRVSALALEARFGLQGEVGLDLAVDPAGRLWLLEANPTPFLDPGEGSQHPFAYARWLALRAWAARYAPLAGPLDGTFVTGVPGPDPGGSGP